MSRNISIDISKGIAIILVVIGHSLYCKGNETLRDVIYSFHMPLFFIIGGCFYKPALMKIQFSKDVKRLLLPYAISGVFLLVVDIIFKDGGMVRLLSFFFPCGFWRIPDIGALWFLVALFWCRESYNLFVALTKKFFKKGEDIAIWAIVIVISYISAYLGAKGFSMFAIVEGTQCLIFYHIGNRFLKGGTLQNDIHIPIKLVAILCITLWGLQIRFAGLELMWCHYTIYPLDIAGSFCATIIMLYIANYISKIKKLASILSWFGNNSLLILCIHASMNVITIHVSNKWGGANTTISDKFRYYSNKPIGLHFKAI